MVIDKIIPDGTQASRENRILCPRSVYNRSWRREPLAGLTHGAWPMGEEEVIMSGNQSSGINVEGVGGEFKAGDLTGRDKITSTTTVYNYGPPAAQSRRSELPHQPYFFGREE